MTAPLVLVTGFGAFLDVERNPSGEIARLLEAEPPEGCRVRGIELPVTFDGAPAAIAEELERLGETPVLLLGTGVHRGPCFRLERQARGNLKSDKPDNSGRIAGAEGIAIGEDLATEFDLEGLVPLLEAPELESVMLSEDAGGYVCERTYHALLTEAGARSIPALFLHVLSLQFMESERQAGYARALVAELIRRTTA